MTLKLGFIGFGKMAEALWNGAKSQVSTDGHCAFEINDSRRNAASALGLEVTSIGQLSKQSTAVILCIKPQNLSDFPAIDWGNSRPIIVSILAGTSIATLAKKFPGLPIARAMPNTPCMVGEGMSAITFSDDVSETQAQDIQTLFRSTGDVVVVPESWMDMITGISGSGPAFLYRLFGSAIAAAATQGIPESVAIQLFAQTLIGAGRMVQESGKSPAQLAADVTSPGGTTVAGLNEFDRQAIDQHFTDVILKTAHRSKELSENK